MSHLIQKHQLNNNKGSGKIQRIKFRDGSYGYVPVNEDDSVIEGAYDNNGRIKAYSRENLTGPYLWVTLDRDKPLVGIQRTPDDHYAALARDRAADEHVDQVIGDSDNYTPWGLLGKGINFSLGKVMEQLPESAQQAIAKGRYLAPSYWLARASGETDNLIMSGNSKFFGTGTSMIFDSAAAPLIGKTTGTTLKTTPYLLGKYGGNTALGNWGRNRTFSRIMNESLGDTANPGALYDSYGPYNTRLYFPYMSRVGRFVESPTAKRVAIGAADDFAEQYVTINGLKIPKNLNPKLSPNGNILITHPETGKIVMYDWYLKKTGQVPKNLGYDPVAIGKEALSSFLGPLERIIDSLTLLQDIATKVKNGNATTEFTTGDGTVISPSARDVLTGEVADATIGKLVRGVGLVNTIPVDGVTTLGDIRYRGRGNFGLDTFSVTNHPGAGRAYGAINYPELQYAVTKSKILTDMEKNEAFSIMKRMRELDGDPLPKMKTNTDFKIKFKSPKEEAEYIALNDRLNELIPGTLEYGGKNRHILFTAPKDQQIISVSSTSDHFGAIGKNVPREELPLYDYKHRRVMTYNPRYKLNVGNSVRYINNGYVGNILEAEKLIGGYTDLNKFGRREFINGWNQTPYILEDKLRHLLIGTNGKLYLRGTGPNGVPGAIDMVTLLAPNGGIPGFKFGKKIKLLKKKHGKYN